MPIYEYRCRNCGEIFEKIQNFGEGAESTPCPFCGEKDLERFAFRLYPIQKGSE